MLPKIAAAAEVNPIASLASAREKHFRMGKAILNQRVVN